MPLHGEPQRRLVQSGRYFAEAIADEPVADREVGGAVLLREADAAAEAGVSGTCLLGEMPHFFAQLPYPKASLAVLEVFVQLAGITIDLAELFEQAEEVDRKLSGLMEEVEQALKQRQREREEDETEGEYSAETSEEGALSAEQQQHIEQLFGQALQDRSKAYELKRELDRLAVFDEYEDRFLDLFKKPT